MAEPTGEAWLVQLQQAARANQAPTDGEALAPDNKPTLLFAELVPSRYVAANSENSYLADLKPAD